MDAYPEDWEKVDFDKCFSFHRNNTCARAMMTDVGGSVRNIHYGDVLVKYDSVLSCAKYDVPFLTEDGVEMSPSDYLQNGDIVIADTAEDEASGKVAELCDVGNAKIVAGLHTVFCRPIDGEKFASGWLGYWMNSHGYHDQLIPLMTGIKVLSLSKASFRRTYVLVPPLPEQRRIAAALGDMDKLIDNLSKRIEKKKAIKQGAMQELLTGKKRLPGFEGEWEMVRIGNIGDFYGGLSGKTAADFGHGEAQYITFMNVLTNIVINRHQVGKVCVYPGEHQNAVKKGDLFFNVSSETPEEVAMCAALLEDMPHTYLNSFCCGFRLFDDSNDPLFISYYVNSHEGRKMTKFLAQGLTRHNLSKDAFRKMEMNWPKKSEQCAIAKVLGDMDAEIAKLEDKREKLIGIKKGMMSDLLTGKVRLKTEMERRK